MDHRHLLMRSALNKGRFLPSTLSATTTDLSWLDKSDVKKGKVKKGEEDGGDPSAGDAGDAPAQATDGAAPPQKPFPSPKAKKDATGGDEGEGDSETRTAVSFAPKGDGN